MTLENMTHDEAKFWAKGLRDAMAAVAKEGLWRCPWCKELTFHPPKDYNICASCWREAGYDHDAPTSEGELLWKDSSSTGPKSNTEEPSK